PIEGPAAAVSGHVDVEAVASGRVRSRHEGAGIGGYVAEGGVADRRGTRGADEDVGVALGRSLDADVPCQVEQFGPVAEGVGGRSRSDPPEPVVVSGGVRGGYHLVARPGRVVLAVPGDLLLAFDDDAPGPDHPQPDVAGDRV